MGWGSKAVSPCVWTPQVTDAGNMTLDSGVILDAGNLVSIQFPQTGARVILLAEDLVFVYGGTDLWPNKAVAENMNFTQSVSANKLTLDLANKRLLTTLGTAKTMTGTLANGISAPFSIFIFGTLTKGANTTNFIDQETSRPAWGWGTTSGQPGKIEMFNGTGSIFTSTADMSSPLAGSACIVVNNTANKFYKNGALVSGTGTGSAPITTSNPLTILNRFSGTYSPGGSLNCFLIYAKALSLEEIQGLHLIASKKYPGVAV